MSWINSLMARSFGRKPKTKPHPGFVFSPAPAARDEPINKKTAATAAAFPRFQSTAGDQLSPRLNDRFAAARIKLRGAFTPSQPITDKRMFAGRIDDDERRSGAPFEVRQQFGVGAGRVRMADDRANIPRALGVMRPGRETGRLGLAVIQRRDRQAFQRRTLKALERSPLEGLFDQGAPFGDGGGGELAESVRGIAHREPLGRLQPARQVHAGSRFSGACTPAWFVCTL